jgi:hypothetical protein
MRVAATRQKVNFGADTVDGLFVGQIDPQQLQRDEFLGLGVRRFVHNAKAALADLTLLHKAGRVVLLRDFNERGRWRIGFRHPYPRNQ